MNASPKTSSGEPIAAALGRRETLLVRAGFIQLVDASTLIAASELVLLAIWEMQCSSPTARLPPPSRVLTESWPILASLQCAAIGYSLRYCPWRAARSEPVGHARS